MIASPKRVGIDISFLCLSYRLRRTRGDRQDRISAETDAKSFVDIADIIIIEGMTERIKPPKKQNNISPIPSIIIERLLFLRYHHLRTSQHLRSLFYRLF